MEPQVLFPAKEPVHLLRRTVGLFVAKGIALVLGVTGVHHQSARGNHGQEHVLIDRQLLLPSCKEAQPRDETSACCEGLR